MNDRAPLFPSAFCAKGHPGDAGGSYDRAHCEEASIPSKLETMRLAIPQTTKERDGWRAEMDRLKRRLEQVRYHGD